MMHQPLLLSLSSVIAQLSPLLNFLSVSHFIFQSREVDRGAVEASGQTEMGAPNLTKELPEAIVPVGLMNGPALAGRELQGCVAVLYTTTLIKSTAYVRSLSHGIACSLRVTWSLQESASISRRQLKMILGMFIGFQELPTLYHVGEEDSRNSFNQSWHPCSLLHYQ